MMNHPQPESKKKITLLFLLLAIVFGFFVRIYPLLRAGFPLVDGGMFYVMIRDLQGAHYSLPAFTTYNQAGIPFAYPPFGLYFSGLLNTLTGVSLLGIIKWQPVVINILIIPLVFLFTRRLLGKEQEAALATLLFALMPNSYWLQIDGGGLTRSWGSIFFLLTAYSAIRMYQEVGRKWVLFTCLAGALTILSHLVWALQAAAAVLLLWAFWGRNRQGILKSLVVLAGTVLLTSPWWLTVLHDHGPGVFYLASQATHSPAVFWAPIISFSFTGETIPVIAVLAILGAFIHLARRDYLPVLWLLLILLVDSRGGVSTTVFPASILAATALCSGIAPALLKVRTPGSPSTDWISTLETTPGRFFWGFWILLLLFDSFNFSSMLSGRSLAPEQLQAFRWAEAHSAPTSRYLVLGWEGNWAYSSLTEWFPALTGLRSITTVQGTEWLAGPNGFLQQIHRYDASRACLYSDVSCLQGLRKDPAIQYDYVYLSLQVPEGGVQLSSLLVSLENSTNFQMVYSSPSEWIFQVVK